MKTMFDINDVVEFSAKGKVEEYSIKNRYGGPDDCYVLLVPTKNEDVRIYLSTKDLKAMHAKKVADVAEQTEWIPCNERLPGIRQWVLCQCRAGIMDVLRLTANGSWEKIYPHTEYMSGFVVAWMPLPEAYKG